MLSGRGESWLSWGIALNWYLVSVVEEMGVGVATYGCALSEMGNDTCWKRSRRIRTKWFAP